MSDYYDTMFDSSTGGATTPGSSDDDAEPLEVRKWKLGDHAARPSTDDADLAADAAKLKGVDDELAELFEAAAARVPNMDLYDFECPVCGLGHGHDDTKHDIRAAFEVTPQFADLMEFSPICHCGVNELAMLVDYYDDLAQQMFEDESALTRDDLDARFDDIKRAAANADIANTTEERIEEMRSEVEAGIEARQPGHGDTVRSPGRDTDRRF